MHRVFHIGACGVHHQNGYCDVQNKVRHIHRRIAFSTPFLFPHRMVWLNIPNSKLFSPRPNGGFADPRDIDLCLRLFQGEKNENKNEIHSNLTWNLVRHLNS